MRGKLAGRVALVTGAGGAACGSAIARGLASEGATVVGVDLHERRASEVMAGVGEAFGVPVRAFTADVADQPAMDEVLATVARELGPVEILVNNAALNVQGSIFDYDPADWRRVLDVDLTACWYLIRATIRGMRELGRGAIVNVSSVAGYLGGGGNEAPYAASKAALHDLTRSTAIEGGPYGIRCNAVAVGIVHSKFVEKHWAALESHVARTPLRRAAQPEEIARVVTFLASDDASFITGDIVNASGGYWLTV
jgi:NAD(P)-dependent dehydrogenase (short-subunit alcohol dehydrogenase family)